MLNHVITAKDEAPFEFDLDATYRADGHPGVAWRVEGFESEPTEETEWSGYEEPTGMIVATMVGDDRPFVFDPEDLTPLDSDDYCSGCGQIGCAWC